jgi:hypothetical protein
MHTQYLVSYKTPQRIMDTYGFHVEKMEAVQTSMHGKTTFRLIENLHLTL